MKTKSLALAALFSLAFISNSVFAGDAILIKGGSVSESKDKSEVVLTKASLLITLEGKNISYFADKVVYKQMERCIELSGNVLIKANSFEAKTDHLVVTLTNMDSKVFVQNPAGVDAPAR